MSELNRCRDKLDFWQYVAAILAMAIMLLSAMLYFCKTAHAGGFVEVGQSNFKKPPDFLWWQSIYQNDFDNKPTYFRIGYEHKGFRLSYFDLGEYRLSALATSDEARLIAGQCNASTCAPPDLTVLINNPEGMSADMLAGAAGYTLNGSTRNCFSKLRTAGLIVGRNTETMRASEELLT